MELELKHILPYLPYGLKFELLDYKCDYVGEKYGVCNGFYPIGEGTYYTFKNRDTAGKNKNNIKPLLTPMSKFDGWAFKKTMYELGITFSQSKELFQLSIGEITVDQITVGLQNALAANHIDFQDLIKQGLAIDKSTIK
jgi:hypothetical protein